MTPPLLSNPDSNSPPPSGLQPSSAVEHIGELIAEMASRIHSATYDLLVLLRDFDARLGWNNGFSSCAHWLHWRTGIDLGAAREKVRVARALADLPLVSGALQRGEISYAKVRALTRIANPENETKLLTFAYHGTAAHVERLARAWRRCDRIEAQQKHLYRFATTYVDDDGMVVLRARLTPELGAVVQQALESAADRLFHDSRLAAPADSIVEEVTPDQRRADALALMAECALQAGLCRDSAADRYQVVVHVGSTTGDLAEASPILDLPDGGIGISEDTSRRLSCDASMVVVHEDAEGNVLDVGRKTRTVPAPIRRALSTRDGRCRFPGCSARRCDAHHIVHWIDGGPTALRNLVLLCRRHHTLVHEGVLSVTFDGAGGVEFTRPDGRRVEVSPALSWHDPHRLPDGVTSGSLRTWDGTRFNLGYAIDVLRPQPEGWVTPHAPAETS